MRENSSKPWRIPTLLIVGATMSVAALPALAQGTFGGFGSNVVHGIEVKAEGATLFSNTTFLAPSSLCRYVYAFKPDFEKIVFGVTAGVSAKLPRGVSLVRQKLDVSPGCTAEASYASGQVFIKATLPRNIYFTNVTTPGPFGQGFDPRFSVDFDVNANGQITIPTTAQQGLVLGRGKARVFNIKPDGQNFTGDIAIAVAKVVDDIGGFGLADKLTQGMDVFTFKGMKIELDKLERALKQRNADAKLQHDYDPQRKVVVINLVSNVARGKWSAFASNSKGRWGFGVHMAQDVIARAAAINGCGGPGQGCKAFWTTQDKCVAFAESRKGGYWYAAAGSPTSATEASDRALKICQSGTAPPKSCQTIKTACEGACPKGLMGPNCDVVDVR